MQKRNTIHAAPKLLNVALCLVSTSKCDDSASSNRNNLIGIGNYLSSSNASKRT